LSETSRNDRLVDLARRLLDGEAIDWDKEGVAESEVREEMQRLQHVIGRREDMTETVAATATPPSTTRSREGGFIGPFRIVRKLGEGGMGVVYEAEQQRPRRLVALKVIRGGHTVDDNALRLFQREIQTLAHLSHPGIAQLYETGVTDDGMHFFAMELIRGEPLSDWLKKRSDGPVTPAEMKIRLGVFRKICDAVAYAHQKGVIHRDLKPGNILIPTPPAGSSIEYAVPEVKILDFGLARMTDTDVQMTTYATEIGTVRGTLSYMSPEQARGNPDAIDLRTDVYSLGVILYEMVTGHLPYDLSRVQLHEAIRIICEDPPKFLATVFAGAKRLDADVATIAGKCLEKAAARRYQSAAALGEDVQRYLTNQPILARPPSAAYQFRKLVMRHKAPFAAAAGAFVLLLAFSIAMTVQAVRIAKERDRANLERDRANQEAETARRVSDFLEGLFKVSDPWSARGKEASPRELVDAGAERIETELKDQPKIQARLMRTLGVVYSGLGVLDKSEPLLKRAAALAESQYGQESLEYADSIGRLGGLENQARAHDIRSRLLRSDDPRMAASHYGLGIWQVMERMPEGKTNLRRALEIVEASSSPDDQLHLSILNDLGLAYSFERDRARAIEYFRKALAIRERIYPAVHVERGMGLGNLGMELMLAGQRQEARRYLEESLSIFERALPSDHPHTSVAVETLGELERLDGHLDRARGLLERALAMRKRMKLDPEAGFFSSLGLLDEAEGRVDEAVLHLGLAHESYSRFPGLANRDPSPDYARVLRKAGRIAEAEQIEASRKAQPTK
jgi:non-specific serine/threonine protein kinase/serine/threonine-protein kinase